MRRRHFLYGWRVGTGGYCLSKVPPDVPQLPVNQFDSIVAAEIDAIQRQYVVIWTGPALTEKQLQEAS